MGSERQQRRAALGLSWELWLVLSVLAGLHAINLGLRLFSTEDNESLESTLVNVVLGQFKVGPTSLYGPFSGKNPRVLIQAPLYYRLAGLVTWPLASLGLSPFDACRLAGRVLSSLGFLGLIFVVCRTARLGLSSARAAIWAVLLLVSSHVVALYPVTTRPDTLGVFFQSLGIYLVLRTITGGLVVSQLYIAMASFAVAFCVKQHNVGPAIVSTLFLLGVWLQNRSSRRVIERSVFGAIMIIVVYFFVEEVLNGGRFFQTTFLLPSRFRRFTAAGFLTVPIFFLELILRSLPMLMIGLGGLLIRPRVFVQNKIDVFILSCLLMELFVIGSVSYKNMGAWLNYGIQAIALASILLARGLDRLCAGRLTIWSAIPCAALIFLGLSLGLGREWDSVAERAHEEIDLQAVLRQPRVSSLKPSQRYFVRRPEYNRSWGCFELMHDEWLYGQFERAGEAEPRMRWLRWALTSGQIQCLIVPLTGFSVIPDEPFTIPGLPEPPEQLGFRLISSAGRFQTWIRREPIR